MALVLTPQIKDVLNNALANGTPLLLAAVTPEGKPILSFRGSAQVYSDNQIGLWLRHAAGETATAVTANPNVVLVYRSPTTPVLQFHGQARIASDEASRKLVFESAPEREQKADEKREGAALIIDLTKVAGVLKAGPDGPVRVNLG